LGKPCIELFWEIVFFCFEKSSRELDVFEFAAFKSALEALLLYWTEARAARFANDKKSEIYRCDRFKNKKQNDEKKSGKVSCELLGRLGWAKASAKICF
jgi:hypothetical protein